MKFPGEPYSLPEDKQQAMRRAKRLAWITLVLMASVTAVIGLAMGSSEAMKAVWIEDLLSLIPPIAFLIGSRYFNLPPDEEFPYGYRRAMMIAFLTAAVALLGFGLYIFIHAVGTLLMAEKPTIQTISIFGRQVWQGWLMIAALVYSVIPPFILGQMKKPLAQELHQKALQTDANMNKGDWLAGLAGILGITGVAYGYWWADAVAAIIISLEILRDGVSDLKNSVEQLMNKRPSDIDGKPDAMPGTVQQELERLDWVRQARVRLREDGDSLTGEAFIVPRDEMDLLNRLEKAYEVANAVNWRLHDVKIVPVRSLE